MKDLFGNAKPVQLEVDEWWFNGRIIQKQDHPILQPFISFNAGKESYYTQTHASMKEAIRYCLDNPCFEPKIFPKDF